MAIKISPIVVGEEAEVEAAQTISAAEIAQEIHRIKEASAIR